MIWSRKKSSKITIPVAGVHCNHCESSIKFALGKIRGVGRVKIRQRKNVIVELDPTCRITRSELIEAIEKAGYAIIASEASQI